MTSSMSCDVHPFLGVLHRGSEQGLKHQAISNLGEKTKIKKIISTVGNNFSHVCFTILYCVKFKWEECKRHA